MAIFLIYSPITIHPHVKLIGKSLKRIVGWMKAHRCERLVKRTASEIEISGGFGAGVMKMEIGRFSRKIKQLVKTTDLALALDDSQYLLCTAASEIKDDAALRNSIHRIRVMIILQITQLRTLLASLERGVSEDLKKELVDWTKYTSQLQKQAISSLNQPKGLILKGKGRTSLKGIMRYQGIEEGDLEEAIKMI
ncbi:MAG: hypothetical protein L6N95_03780 [Candidatus Methylarchaceae archaeon HK01B]|nr:hypothetical protein [Candidatus Methylarchaceae archaeon HK01B]